MDPKAQKKRKRATESGAKSSKRIAFDTPSETAKVDGVLQPEQCPPVIAILPGLQLPKDTLFHSYVPENSLKNPSKRLKSIKNTDFILHSQAHHTLDYTAKVDDPLSTNSHLNHYVGVFDPKNGKLEVIEAKKMFMRGSVRAKQADSAAMGKGDAAKTMMDRKLDLGLAFGTKKAKKFLEDSVRNVIVSPKKQGDAPAVIDNAGHATLKSIHEITKDMATREELQASIDAAKPVPRANLEAEEIQEVYDPDEIIGADILKLVPVQEWKEKVKHSEGVQTPSRFVATRVNALASNDTETTRLRVLRYLSLVLIFYLRSKPGRQKGERLVLPRDKLKEALAPAPESVVENIRRKFSEAGVIRKFHTDLLITHCCAFAAIVDNFSVDTQNLRDDLRLDQKAMNTYFREIGAKVKVVSNSEGHKVAVASLAMPLEFPKQRRVARRTMKK